MKAILCVFGNRSHRCLTAGTAEIRKTVKWWERCCTFMEKRRRCTIAGIAAQSRRLPRCSEKWPIQSGSPTHFPKSRQENEPQPGGDPVHPRTQTSAKPCSLASFQKPRPLPVPFLICTSQAGSTYTPNQKLSSTDATDADCSDIYNGLQMTTLDLDRSTRNQERSIKRRRRLCGD